MRVHYFMFTPNAKGFEYKSWRVFTSSILAFWIFGAENCIVWGLLGGGGGGEVGGGGRAGSVTPAVAYCSGE